MGKITTRFTKIYTHAFHLYAGTGVVAKDGRRINEADLDIIEDAALIETSGQVLWFGKTRDLPKKYLKSKHQNLKLKRSLMPGLVDCHTHLVFAGDRSQEFAQRCAGISYEEIAQNGGGIQSTVKATRNASASELFVLAVERVNEMIARGVRGIEIKSGYGLDEASEIKLLKVIAKLRKKFPQIVFHSTYMGAHAIPFGKTAKQYLLEISNKTLPFIARGKLAQSCDVFTEKNYFSCKESKELLSRAKNLGLHVRVHADELNNLGAAEMAVELGALSADHLLKVSSRGIQALSRSQTVAVLLPGTAFFLKAPYAPARALIDSGACVAIATDFNPGTCMTTSLPFAMTLAALQMKMSQAEIFAAVTYNAAKAIDEHKHLGAIKVGERCFPIVTPFKTFEETYYRFGW